jgi:hypothetical protein
MNKYTTKDIHEGIGDIRIAELAIFTTLHLASGFWQMPIHARLVPKTAFTLPGLGKYKWLTSPIGLLGCPASFKCLMEKPMDNISNIIVYINDLLVHSQSHEQHLM